MNAEEMDKLVAQLEGKVRRSFVEMVRSMRSENSITELAGKISRGDLTNLVEGVDVAVEKLATDISAGYVKAGQKAARWLNEKVPRAVRFNIASEDSMAWMEEMQSSITRSLVTEQQELARMVIADGRVRGLTDAQIAEEVRDSIGLTKEQYKHVSSYRRSLETGDYQNALGRKLGDKRSTSTLRAARSENKLLGAERIDRMVGRYRDRFVRSRADTVALTEANGASHAGVQELLEQAIENGDVSANDLERVWVTRGDHKVRSTHRTMNNQVRSMNQPFKSGGGVLLKYPGDPDAPGIETVNCRCVIRIKYKRSTFRTRTTLST